MANSKKTKKASKKKVSLKKLSKKKPVLKKTTKEQERLLQSLVEELAGEGSERIVEILFNKKDVNEFLIAKKMELTINQVRNILYKLSAKGLVSFIRKKDKRKGWYIYYWTLNTEKCLIQLEQSIKGKIEKLNQLLLKRETKRYYVCKSCNIEVNEEVALEHNFSCEECAEIYELSDNVAPIKEIKNKIARAERGLKIIQIELEVIREKKEKARIKNEKKLEKEKAEEKERKKIERQKKRKATMKLKKKDKEKLKKKPAKKLEKKTKKGFLKKIKKIVKRKKK